MRKPALIKNFATHPPSGTNLAATTITSGTGTWSQTDGPGVNGNPGNSATIADVNNEATAVSNLEAGTYMFTWTVTNGGCILEDTVTIVNFAEPSLANAGVDQTLGSI